MLKYYSVLCVSGQITLKWSPCLNATSDGGNAVKGAFSCTIGALVE